MTESKLPLEDAEQRRVICEDTDRTLFVEAGAGSGKTRSLVERIVRLVLVDEVPLRAIAAVTFTEKAGAELRDRLRAALEQARHPLADRALDDLDSAAIGTLHSFAQRILGEHPIQAGLPPLVEVADELSSSVAFEERWAEQRRRLLDDDAIAPTLLLAMSAGVTLDHLRTLAKLLGNDWDLARDRILGESGAPSSVEIRELERLVERAAELAERASDCTQHDDKFLPKLEAIGAWGRRLGAAEGTADRFDVLRAAAGLNLQHGQGPNWGGKDRLDALRADCKELVAQAAEVVRDVVEQTLRILARWLAASAVQAAEERRTAGRLEFLDLLVLAREVLRDAGVRAALQRRYPRLLLDEFQDTDPIQIELAVRIAGGAAATQERWEDVEVPAGSLFVVGDPKQSIYRFRRADIGVYLRAQEVFGQRRGTNIELTTNFRTVPAVLDWINQVFGRLMRFQPGVQPGYRPLKADRAPAQEGGPAVVVVGAEAHEEELNADALRAREAADVAGVVRQAVAEKWQVRDGVTKTWRDARLDDIAILVPSRTSLPALEAALDSAGIAYRAEASSLVYQAPVVRDLLAATRAIADPSDAHALVTALRSPLFACGDDDLWTWKHAGGAFHLLVPAPDDVSSSPVGRAVAYLAGLHGRARWMTPAQVLATLVADRRMFEVAATGQRARDDWRALRFVVDQARAWTESEHGGLRAYLAWAALQGGETTRVSESALPETDARSVRIMTVHAAKGLEFPIVVMSGMTTEPRRQSGVRVLWPEGGGYAVSLSKHVSTGDFATAAPIDEQMSEEEGLRLLYVAATRAQDHLVVSLHRCAGSTTRTAAYRLAEGGATEGAEAWAAPERHEDGEPEGSATDGPQLPEYAAWLASVERAREAGRRAASVSASGLEGTEPEVVLTADESRAGEAKGPVNVELPPWAKGRHGTAIGRAVHGVLQAIDLRTGDGLDAAVAAQCVAENVDDETELVAALVRSALAAPEIRRAAQRPHWREMYVGTVKDGTVLEGFVDLVYREDDGSLVVVDYKTDAIPGVAIAARSRYYAPQLRAYTRMLADAGAAENIEARLAFLGPEAAAVVPLPATV
ncbi:UvrD-helicase domain-containing protein [Geodermatophilus sp. SYSU D01119]